MQKASSLPAIIVARRGLIVKLRRAFFSSTPRRQPPRAQTPVPELKPARRNAAPACNSRSLKAENRFFASARNNADSKGRRTTTVTRALTESRPPSGAENVEPALPAQHYRKLDKSPIYARSSRMVLRGSKRPPALRAYPFAISENRFGLIPRAQLSIAVPKKDTASSAISSSAPVRIRQAIA